MCKDEATSTFFGLTIKNILAVPKTKKLSKEGKSKNIDDVCHCYAARLWRDLQAKGRTKKRQMKQFLH
jgi:hypothetical protein